MFLNFGERGKIAFEFFEGKIFEGDNYYRVGKNQIENFRRIVDDFPRRLDACIEAGGKHFE
jgi:hypothetical protein